MGILIHENYYIFKLNIFVTRQWSGNGADVFGIIIIHRMK